jgi:hypothetical protein
MDNTRRIHPLFLVAGFVILILALVLLIRSCTTPTKSEQETMTAVANATQAVQDTKIAALTAVIIGQTQTAMPTPTPLPQYICIDRGNFMGMSAVLEPFEIVYDPDYTYEFCVVDEEADEEVCLERKPLEKGEYGPIIPDTDTWIVIPEVEEEGCLDNRGRWVLDASK